MARIVVAANNAWNIVNYRQGLVRALQVEGHEVTVVAPAGPDAAAIRALGAHFHPLAMAPRGRSPIADLALLLRFRRLLRRLRPDWFFGFTAKPNIWGSLAARAFGIRVIANISGLGAAFAGTGPLSRLVGNLYRLALRRPAIVFFQNREDLELFIDRRIIARDQAKLLPGSGVDLDHFSPLPAVARAGQRTRFLFAGRLLWAKGLAEYVEAGALLPNGGRVAELAILGLPEPAGPTAVPLARLEAWHAAGAIQYLGAAADVRPHIAAADCVVLPSFYREGVPHILLEAAAMARPIITTDTPGCRDTVEDGVTGWLCAPRSVASLAAAMEQAYDAGHERRLAMGKAGRRKMERQFDQRIVHRAYIDALS